MRYEVFIALRHLTSRRRQSLISISAIGIAVMILVVSNAFMAGFTEEIYEVTVEKLPHIVVSPDEGEDHIHFYKSILPKIEHIEGVMAASPILQGEASFRHKDKSLNGIIMGVDPKKEDRISHISQDMVEGNYYSLEHTRNTIVIGDDLAEDLEVRVGDEISVSFPTATSTSFEIIGIFDTDTPADELFTYTALKTAQQFYDTGDAINLINIRASDYNDDQKIAGKIKDLGYEAQGWTQTNPEILQTIAIEKTSNNIMLGLILLIASFGVVSTLNMVVMEKVGEIGILMAMGTPGSTIRRIFILESGILGLIGAMIGSFSGVLIALMIGSYTVPADFYGIEKIPVIINSVDIFITVIGVFLLNLVAGVYPAQRAARLDPVEAISSN
ncbi:ABC transporter permease [Methanococcoides sp. SA1]|nr:ABC transporter permease [Methanococcoides sp. SA1]